MTDDDDDWDDECSERFEQVLLKALRPGEKAKFAIVLLMTRDDDDTNQHVFGVSSEGDMDDSDLAQLLGHGMDAVKADAN
jgi:hypothetical protein